MLSKTLLAVAALAVGPAQAIWPDPRESSLGSTYLYLDQTVEVTYNGEPVRLHSLTTPNPKSHTASAAAPSGQHREQLAETRFEFEQQQLSYAVGYSPPSGSKFNSKDIVQGGLERTFTAIFEHGLVPWMLRDRNANIDPPSNVTHDRIASLVITQTEEDDENTFKPVAGTVDEGYTLSVSLEGEAALEAASSTGVLRGLETFTQLFFQHSNGRDVYTPYAPVEIEDAPEYPHRGLLLDVGRHWFELDDIKRTIDGLAMSKMNVLHLHITETQSWPLEIPALPRLAQVGRYAPGLTYSPEQIAELYEYGVHRGVQVIMEIDMPGHIGVEEAYPGISVAYDVQPYQWYCAQPPCGSFKLNSTDVEDFLDTLFDDLLPRLNPYSAYFHTGGDEYKANNSLLDPALETNDVAVLQPLLQRFLDHAHGRLRDHGLIPFVWEEMLLEWNATLGEDVVIQSWLGNNAIKEVAEMGHKVIDSNYNFYYLDCGRGQWLDFPNGPSFDTFYPFNDWCQPLKNWRLMYTHDPRDGVADEFKQNVLGGEVASWTETIDPVSLDTIIWPRAGVAGHVWWSGVLDSQGRNRSQYDARPRLSEQRERMLKRGIRGTPITQLWCDQNSVERCGHEEQ